MHSRLNRKLRLGIRVFKPNLMSMLLMKLTLWRKLPISLKIRSDKLTCEEWDICIVSKTNSRKTLTSSILKDVLKMKRWCCQSSIMCKRELFNFKIIPLVLVIAMDYLGHVNSSKRSISTDYFLTTVVLMMKNLQPSCRVYKN